MKYILSFCLIFFNFQTVQASNESTILVYSNNMQTMFLLTKKQDNTILIETIPSSLLLPITCANNARMPLSSITNESTQSCLQRTLATAFQIQIKNYVYLDLEKIEKDYDVSLKHHQLLSFPDFQTYFEELGTQIDASVIWKYSSYIRTDLSLMDLYDFYSMYTSSDFKILYGFPNLYKVDEQWIPLSRTFHNVFIE